MKFDMNNALEAAVPRKNFLLSAIDLFRNTALCFANNPKYLIAVTLRIMNRNRPMYICVTVTDD